jgi:hypothetical protein
MAKCGRPRESDGRPCQQPVRQHSGLPLGPRHPSHGVVAPYAAGETLFGPTLTRYDVARRHDAGARITLAPADGTIPSGDDVLFLITPDDALIAATTPQALVPRSGDTLVVLR